MASLRDVITDAVTAIRNAEKAENPEGKAIALKWSNVLYEQGYELAEAIKTAEPRLRDDLDFFFGPYRAFLSLSRYWGRMQVGRIADGLPPCLLTGTRVLKDFECEFLVEHGENMSKLLAIEIENVGRIIETARRE